MQNNFKNLVATFAIPAVLVGAAAGLYFKSGSSASQGPGTSVSAVSPVVPGTEKPVTADPTATHEAPVLAANPPVATATPEPVEPTPQAEEPPNVEMPRVLSMRSDHAGPGAVIVRFSTNVPVSAEIRVMSNQSGDEFSYSETLVGAGTEHVISVPANFGRYVVRVEDEYGNESWGTLRYGADPQGIDFDNAPYAPVLKAQTAKKLLVSWGFASDHPMLPVEPGTVFVYSRDASCTTADACVGEIIGPAFASAVETKPEADYHSVLVSIPGSAFDYQVVIAHSTPGDEHRTAFMQLEIRGDQLPKTNFSGPGSITR